jgi:hypothetical protein
MVFASMEDKFRLANIELGIRMEGWRHWNTEPMFQARTRTAAMARRGMTYSYHSAAGLMAVKLWLENSN